MATEPTDIHLNPLSVLHSLDKILPENAILVAYGGEFSLDWLLTFWSHANCWASSTPELSARWWKAVGGSFALGANLARPDSEVQCPAARTFVGTWIDMWFLSGLDRVGRRLVRLFNCRIRHLYLIQIAAHGPCRKWRRMDANDIAIEEIYPGPNIPVTQFPLSIYKKLRCE